MHFVLKPKASGTRRLAAVRYLLPAPGTSTPTDFVVSSSILRLPTRFERMAAVLLKTTPGCLAVP